MANVNAGLVAAAAASAVEAVLNRPLTGATPQLLRAELAEFDETERDRREEAEAERERLVAAIADAEHAERIEAARARLTAEAEDHDAEASRLDALADGIAEQLAAIDTELARLREQRSAVEAAMESDANAAEQVLTSDPERAAALVAANMGRQAALRGLDERIAGAQRRRASIESGAGLPGEPEPTDGPKLFVDGVDTQARDLGSLRKLAARHRAQAAPLRQQADHLSDAPPEDDVLAGFLGALVGSTLLAASRLGRAAPPPGPRPFGYAPGSLGEGAERVPPRRRRGR